jgi:hypothetical protein
VGMAFLKVKNSFLQLPVSLLQVCKSQHFCGPFFGKKIPPSRQNYT